MISTISDRHVYSQKNNIPMSVWIVGRPSFCVVPLGPCEAPYFPGNHFSSATFKLKKRKKRISGSLWATFNLSLVASLGTHDINILSCF
jgi:hypothetical protein